MPKGVICGGAVDGSNQPGEMVTCQAMVTLPDGAGPAMAPVERIVERIAETIAPRARATTGRNREKARDRRRTWDEAMGTFRVAMGSRTLLERFKDDGSTLLGSQPAACSRRAERD